MKKRVVIFTDLDGTLLDKNYSFKKALPALKILKEMEIPLVICSSKTKAEIEFYRKKLENKDPFISENGGGIFIPRDYFFHTKKRYKVIRLGKPYKTLKKILKKIKEKIRVKGFSEMSAKELAEDSGLSLTQAKLAKKSDFDEAFKLLEKEHEKELIKLIRKYKLRYTKGEKYYHILGDNDKGKAVKILIELYKKKFREVITVSLGDSENDLPMLKVTDKGFMIKGPKEWNKTVLHFLHLDKKWVRKGESLFVKSLKILKKFQLKNGAILASSPKGRYPFIYPRDHSIATLAFIEAGLLERAKKALEFILSTQNKDGSFPQRTDKHGRDSSYKPIQLDNTSLVLYTFAKYIQETSDKEFLIKYRGKINKSLAYLKSQLTKKNLFFTPNSIHEFPPLEKGLEIWANAVTYGALKELKKIKVRVPFDLEKIKKAIEKYFWNGEYFIKNIRIKESSSVVEDIDASSYALAEFGVFDYDNEKIKKTVERIEKELWNKKLGGICRYKKYIGRNNGGYGPWPHFTLMICRYFIKRREKEKADKYLEWIFKIAYKNLLPEHIALKKEFEEWVREYRKAGILRKDREIMIKNIRKHPFYKKRSLAYSVLPLTWPHAEFIRTWILYKKNFLNVDF